MISIHIHVQFFNNITTHASHASYHIFATACTQLHGSLKCYSQNCTGHTTCAGLANKVLLTFAIESQFSSYMSLGFHYVSSLKRPILVNILWMIGFMCRSQCSTHFCLITTSCVWYKNNCVQVSWDWKHPNSVYSTYHTIEVMVGIRVKFVCV